MSISTLRIFLSLALIGAICIIAVDAQENPLEGSKAQCVVFCHFTGGPCKGKCCSNKDFACVSNTKECMCVGPTCKTFCQQTTGPCHNKCCPNWNQQCEPSGNKCNCK